MNRRTFTTEEALKLVRKYGSAKAAAVVLGVTRQTVARRLNANVAGWKNRHGMLVSHRFAAAERKQAIDLYRAGEKLEDIAADTGISLKWLNTLMRREGIQRRPGCAPMFKPEDCCAMYKRFGTYAAAAEVLGCSVSTVARAVQEAR